jgi:hypothetical protein
MKICVTLSLARFVLLNQIHFSSREHSAGVFLSSDADKCTHTHRCTHTQPLAVKGRKSCCPFSAGRDFRRQQGGNGGDQ